MLVLELAPSLHLISLFPMMLTSLTWLPLLPMLFNVMSLYMLKMTQTKLLPPLSLETMHFSLLCLPMPTHQQLLLELILPWHNSSDSNSRCLMNKIFCNSKHSFCSQKPTSWPFNHPNTPPHFPSEMRKNYPSLIS